MTINVLQGEREFATDNRLLGTFNLEGIPPAPRGMPQIEVTFNVDVNGILTVAAKDKGTGKENKITVQNAGGLSKDEIEKMKRDAEAHAAEDKKRREVIDLKNQGENLAYQTEKTLKEHGEKVARRRPRATSRARSNNLARRAQERRRRPHQEGDGEPHSSVSHKLAEEMYKARRRRPAAAAGGRRSPGRPRHQRRPRRGRRRRRRTRTSSTRSTK